MDDIKADKTAQELNKELEALLNRYLPDFAACIVVELPNGTAILSGNMCPGCVIKHLSIHVSQRGYLHNSELH